MCKESNEDDTKETLQNKQTKGTHESSVGILVCVHTLQVFVHVKHVVVLVVLRFTLHLYVNSLSFLIIVHIAKTGRLRSGLTGSWRPWPYPAWTI